MYIYVYIYIYILTKSVIYITDFVNFYSKSNSLVWYTFLLIFVIDYYLHNLQKLANNGFVYFL